jgi:hypothetical protein
VTGRPTDRPLRWTFILPGLARPSGGQIAAYELANALSTTDEVRVVYLPTAESRLRSTADLPWFRFRPEVEHSFPRHIDLDGLPESDLVVHTVMTVDLCLDEGTGRAAGALLSHLLGKREGPSGLPVLFLQALGIFSETTEMLALSGSGPKACVASWIARNLVAAGLPPDEAVPIINGVDHRTFRVTRPIAGRPVGVAMNHNPHPLKNMRDGIEALERVEHELGVPSTLFGARRPAQPLRGHMRFVDSPRQSQVARDILSSASIYLQPSTQEGFGLCALEAMACGCALVTTDNGGSEDYALDGETAVVCATEPGAMADAVISLVHDDTRRIRIATRGAERARHFTWAAGAERLRSLGMAYLADPGRFSGGPDAPLDPSVRWLHRG